MRIAFCALASIGLAFLASSAKAGEVADAISGVWGTQGMNAKVTMARCQDPGGAELICGTITWLWEPFDRAGQPKTDSENPDARLRNRSLIGVKILSGFRRKTSDKFDGGMIYNPEDGRTYDSTLRLQGPDTLVVEGCFLFICRKQIWRRVSSICQAMMTEPKHYAAPFGRQPSLTQPQPMQPDA
jgi:uncharacterized protein (DUF2147 family)